MFQLIPAIAHFDTYADLVDYCDADPHAYARFVAHSRTGCADSQPGIDNLPGNRVRAQRATSPPKTITVSNPKKGKNPPSITITSVVPAGDANAVAITSSTTAARRLGLGTESEVHDYRNLHTERDGQERGLADREQQRHLPLVKPAGTGALTNLTAAPKSLKFPAITVGGSQRPADSIGAEQERCCDRN